MARLFHQNLLVLDRLCEALLRQLPVERHADEIRQALKKGEIGGFKSSGAGAVDFEHAPGSASAGDQHIDGATHPVLGQ